MGGLIEMIVAVQISINFVLKLAPKGLAGYSGVTLDKRSMLIRDDRYI